MKLDPSVQNITRLDYPLATSYIQNDAPGYQVQYSPIDSETEPPFTFEDCRVFGIPYMAIELCLKTANSSMLAGMSDNHIR